MVEDRTSIYLCHRLLFEFPVNLKHFGHVLYNRDDYTYVQSQPIHEISTCSGNIEHIGFSRLLPENAFKHCIRQRYTTKTNTVTLHFYCNFRPYMTCWIFVPSFITNLWQIFFPGNHLKGATSQITHLEKIGKFFQVCHSLSLLISLSRNHLI